MVQAWSKLQPLAARAARVATSREAREFLANAALKELSYTHRLERSFGRPQIFQLETTNQCPYTCIMCPRTHAMTRDVGHMDFALFRDIVDQLEPAWQKDAILAPPLLRLLHYGEPMVYRHFRESIEHCHRRGFEVYISTNPSVWTERRIEEVLETGLDQMLVMIDGMDDETSTAIRGRAASFVRGEAQLSKLVERKLARGSKKPHITVAMIKQKRNAHQWRLFRDYWRDIAGVDEVCLAPYSTFDGDVEAINVLGDELAAVDREQAEHLARQRALALFPCVYPWHSVSVAWDGRVVPCCRDYNSSVVLGDLRKDSLEVIWNGAPIRKLRRELAGAAGEIMETELCKTCKEPSAEVGLPRHYPARLLMRSS